MSSPQSDSSAPPLSPLAARFDSRRWSRARRVMDGMKAGDAVELPMSEYYNAKASAGRLSDAYPDRRWSVSKRGGKLTVRCDAVAPDPAPR